MKSNTEDANNGDTMNVELYSHGDGEYRVRPKRYKMSLDQGFFISVSAIQLLREKNKRTIFVGIAGPSGSGKTTLAKKIATVMPKSIIISLDNYLDSSRKVIDENFDDYRLIDFQLLLNNITDLKQGKTTNMPLYDFRKSGRYAYKKINPPHSKVVIIEGTYALHDEISMHMDLKIAVSGGVHYDLIKRVFRDVQRTGQHPHETLRQITETVYPMYKAFIEPCLEGADFKIVNHFNPFSGLLNPTYELKTNKAIPSELIQKVIQDYCQANPHLHFHHQKLSYYDIFLLPPDISTPSIMASNNSQVSTKSNGTQFIRVRNNNGHYSLLFSEVIKEDGFIISPDMEFTVDVKTLGGLMALGYSIVAILNRKSNTYCAGDELTVSVDEIEEFGGQKFVQVKGKNREVVAATAKSMNFGNDFISLSYIELYKKKMATSKIDVPVSLFTPSTDSIIQSKL